MPSFPGLNTLSAPTLMAQLALLGLQDPNRLAQVAAATGQAPPTGGGGATATEALGTLLQPASFPVAPPRGAIAPEIGAPPAAAPIVPSPPPPATLPGGTPPITPQPQETGRADSILKALAALQAPAAPKPPFAPPRGFAPPQARGGPQPQLLAQILQLLAPAGGAQVPSLAQLIGGR